MAQPHISLAAEKIGSIAGFPITNSILTTWIVMGFLVLVTYLATRKMSYVPSSIQSVSEMIVEGLHTLFASVVGAHFVNKFFPLLATIFLFVVVANWFGLLPGVGSIGFFENGETPPHATLVSSAYAETKPALEVEEVRVVEQGESAAEAKNTEHESKFVPLFRGPTADLNTTLALALISVFMIQFYGIKALGLAYFQKFLNFSNPIMFGIGLLEIVSEFSRIISFAFRLFGNIFAGEVLLTVIAFLMPLLAPLPFLGLELFVGVVQALVFSMLTAVFLNMATTAHAEH